ncbi:MAG: D-alanyl-D-alanine carboxypeptidase family protein [Cyclobacteriaceae bacterium]|nr:D-alanyl-D-alanine carboxypeptidase family protein [Cyclobacteriaceae bacterium]
MNAKEYCKIVEQKVHLQKQLRPTIPIKEDHSPLVSLKESGFNLIFEPASKKNYKYFVREALVEKIGRISKFLDKEDKVLIIRSVWRSFEHQQLIRQRKAAFLQKIHPDKSPEEINEVVSNFIAPRTKSTHATGGAIDALIYDLKNDCVMDFGTNNGLNIDLNKKCYPYHPDITPQAKKNRKLLISLFEKEDFVCDLVEYWHFDYGNVIWALEKGKKYSIYDIIKA